MSISDFENGFFYTNGENNVDISKINWKKHPKFPGVFMKSLIFGKNTGNKLSAIIVKIEPQHEIGNHIHEGKAELHEIICGEGIAIIGNKKVNYKPGVISFIPGDVPHCIKAEEKEMILFAKFTPALE